MLKNRLIRVMPLFLAAALQVMPMLRSLVPAVTQGLTPSAWSIILKIGAGTVALMGSYHAVSGASTTIVPLATGYTVYLTNGILYKNLLTTGPESAGSWSTNNIANSGTAAFQMFPGVSLTNSNGKIGGVPVLASGVATNSVVITAWHGGGNTLEHTYTNFTFIAFSATPGAVAVNFSPTGAVAAGARWEVDSNGIWLATGIATNLPPGSHTISYSNVSGWTTPSNHTVTIGTGVLARVTGTYAVAPAGALQVNLSPAGAVTAGAQWQVDGGALQSSGAVVAGLNAGNHAVAFKPVSGWLTPGGQTPSVTGGTTNTISGTYVQIAAPVITNFTVSGTSLVLKGSGTAGAGFSVLSTNNVKLPHTNWPVIFTGTITNGTFIYNGTSSPAAGATFYRVSSQ